MDAHCELILEEFREHREAFERLKDFVLDSLRDTLKKNNLLVTAVEGRVKEEKSLAGKLDLKGYKYKSLSDITDIVGCRVIAFYTNEVDKIAALVEQMFEVDWENSVDKRKLYEADQFGYMSLHYVIRVPKEIYSDPKDPDINRFGVEIQMRTTLQHAWAMAYHDTGYKSDIEVPREYIRALNRLAGVLEIADEEFRSILTSIEEYRRQVRQLIHEGNYADLQLNGDTFRNYMEINPFGPLNERIASVNRAEIQPASTGNYFEVFARLFRCKTIEDLETMRKECEEDAYRLAVRRIAGTDLDILSANVGMQNVCTVKILKCGYGIETLTTFYDTIYGPRDRNHRAAAETYKLAKELNIIHETKEE